MEIIVHHICNSLAGYKKSYPDPVQGDEIKKMITTGMLRRQVQMTDDNEFDHILENLQSLLKRLI